MTGSGMEKLKGLFKATVSNLFFLIKNVLVPRTSHIKGLHVQTTIFTSPGIKFQINKHSQPSHELHQKCKIFRKKYTNI